MSARAIWKGRLRFDSESVAVKLYAAVEDRRVHFRLLSRSSGRPVEQRMVAGDDGREVPGDKIRKGYEVERGRFVVLDDEELEKLAPPAGRDIEMLRFVPPSAIDHRWYERPYWLGPDEGAEAAYTACAEALNRLERVGVARWTMRKRARVGALSARDHRLLLVALRHAEEVLPASELEPPSGGEPTARERKMAEQLVETLAGEFDPTEYRDTERENVRELIEKKLRGEKIRPPRKRLQRRPASLENALEASLKRAPRGSRG